MPKRVKAHLSQIPMTGGDPFESMDSRRRRLFPQSFQPPPAELPGSSSTDPAHQVPDAARSVPTVERNPNRADAPVLHPSRRGSRAKATAAARDVDPEALVQELLADRHSASAVNSAASLLRGWRHYHLLAHQHMTDPPPPYPVTADSIIRVGSLFKKGGYRSFPNYLSAGKTRHIEGPPSCEWT